jgi:hypothetical protein
MTMTTFNAEDEEGNLHYGIVQCPGCGEEAIYHKPLDRTFHADGTDNDHCWVMILRGEARHGDQEWLDYVVSGGTSPQRWDRINTTHAAGKNRCEAMTPGPASGKPIPVILFLRMWHRQTSAQNL